MMTRNDAVALQLFCVMMTFSDALPVLSTKNDGHCHHSRMGVFPDYYLKIIGWPARLIQPGATSLSTHSVTAVISCISS